MCFKKNNGKHPSGVLRVISAALLFCFSLTSISPPARGEPPFFSVSLPQTETGDRPLISPVDEIQIPEFLGTVEKTFLPASLFEASNIPIPNASRGVVVHIQDPHGHYEAQKNIEKILEHLSSQYGFDLLFLEGAAGSLKGEALDFFGDLKLNREAADLLAKEGVAGGPELFLLSDAFREGGPRARAFGIEEPALYRKNLETFRSVAVERERAERFISKLHALISTEASRIFSKTLLDFFRAESSYWKGREPDVQNRLASLGRFAKTELGLDLANPREQVEWPQLVRLFKLKELEGKIDLKRAREDQAKLIVWIRRNGLDEHWVRSIEIFDKGGAAATFQSQEREGIRNFYERFYSAAGPKGFRFKPYPDFTRRAAAQILQSELNAASLFEETEHLTRLLFDRLAKSSSEKELIRLYEDSLLLQKLLRLELTDSDYAKVQGAAGELRPSEMIARLRKLRTPSPFTLSPSAKHRWTDPSFGGSGGEGIRRGKAIVGAKEEYVFSPLPREAEGEGRVRVGESLQENNLSKMDDLSRKALLFYEDARAREKKMFDRLTEKLSETGRSNAVLITGGFHAAGLAEPLKASGFSYLKVTPRISELGTDRKYLDLITLKADFLAMRSHLRLLSPDVSLGEEGIALSGKPYAHQMAGMLFAARAEVRHRHSAGGFFRDSKAGKFLKYHRLSLLPFGDDKLVLTLSGEPVQTPNGGILVLPSGELTTLSPSTLARRAELHEASPRAVRERRSEVRSENATPAEESKQSWQPEPQKIAVIGGAGFVGATKAILLVTDYGHDVVAMDKDESKIETLRSGTLPHYEPGLEELLQEALIEERADAGGLHFTADLKEAVEDRGFIFLALPTPQNEIGEADISYLRTSVEDIAKLMEPGEEKIVIVKSTAPPETYVKLKKAAETHLPAGAKIHFVSEPEFLREGKAVEDDRGEAGRIVIGGDDPEAVERVAELYAHKNPRYEIKEVPIVKMDLLSAPLVKYAANGFRGLKISFINFISWLTGEIGFDVNDIADEIGKDPRIRRAFLSAGLGFGGSCFPKDFLAFVQSARMLLVSYDLMLDALAVNSFQWRRFEKKIENRLDGVRDKTILILGAAFKPDTSDVREARSIRIISELLNSGAHVRVFDPVAIKNLKRELGKDAVEGETIFYYGEKGEDLEEVYQAIVSDVDTGVLEAELEAESALVYQAIVSDADTGEGRDTGVDAIVLVTEWPMFRDIDFRRVRRDLLDAKRTRPLPPVFDGRNYLDGAAIKKLGFDYLSMGQRADIQPGVSRQEFVEAARRFFLALKVSFINMVAEIAEKRGADIRSITKALGLDPVVGEKHMVPGVGWGGYELSKGLKSIEEWADKYLKDHQKFFASRRQEIAKKYGFAAPQEKPVEMEFLIPFVSAVKEINERQIRLFIQKAKEAAQDHFKDKSLKDKTAAVLGLAYKRGTHATDDAPSLRVINALLEEGVREVKVTDAHPQSIANVRQLFAGEHRITYHEKAEKAIMESDLQVLVTDWDQYKNWQGLFFDEKGNHITKHSVVVDGRHMFDQEELEAAGIRYYAVGVPTKKSKTVSPNGITETPRSEVREEDIKKEEGSRRQEAGEAIHDSRSAIHEPPLSELRVEADRVRKAWDEILAPAGLTAETLRTAFNREHEVKRPDGTKERKKIELILEPFIPRAPDDVNDLVALERSAWSANAGVVSSEEEVRKRILGDPAAGRNPNPIIVIRDQSGKMNGAIFMSFVKMEGDDYASIPQTYDQAAAAHDPEGSVIIDFSVVTDVNNSSRSYKPFPDLAKATIALAQILGKKSVIAYSRAEFFWYHIMYNPKFDQYVFKNQAGRISFEKVFQIFERLHPHPTFQDYVDFFKIRKPMQRGFPDFDTAFWTMRMRGAKGGMQPTVEDVEEYFNLGSFKSFGKYAGFHLNVIGDPFLTQNHQALGAKPVDIILGSRPEDLRSAGANVLMRYEIPVPNKPFGSAQGKSVTDLRGYFPAEPQTGAAPRSEIRGNTAPLRRIKVDGKDGRIKPPDAFRKEMLGDYFTFEPVSFPGSEDVRFIRLFTNADWNKWVEHGLPAGSSEQEKNVYREQRNQSVFGRKRDKNGRFKLPDSLKKAWGVELGDKRVVIIQSSGHGINFLEIWPEEAYEEFFGPSGGKDRPQARSEARQRDKKEIPLTEGEATRLYTIVRNLIDSAEDVILQSPNLKNTAFAAAAKAGFVNSVVWMQYFAKPNWEGKYFIPRWSFEQILFSTKELELGVQVLGGLIQYLQSPADDFQLDQELDEQIRAIQETDFSGIPSELKRALEKKEVLGFLKSSEKNLEEIRKIRAFLLEAKQKLESWVNDFRTARSEMRKLSEEEAAIVEQLVNLTPDLERYPHPHEYRPEAGDHSKAVVELQSLWMELHEHDAFLGWNGKYGAQSTRVDEILAKAPKGDWRQPFRILERAKEKLDEKISRLELERLVSLIENMEVLYKIEKQSGPYVLGLNKEASKALLIKHVENFDPPYVTIEEASGVRNPQDIPEQMKQAFQNRRFAAYPEHKEGFHQYRFEGSDEIRKILDAINSLPKKPEVDSFPQRSEMRREDSREEAGGRRQADRGKLSVVSRKLGPAAQTELLTTYPLPLTTEILEVAKNAAKQTFGPEISAALGRAELRRAVDLIAPGKNVFAEETVLSAEASRALNLIRKNKEAAAPFVYVRDPVDTGMTNQLFEAAALFVGENKAGVHRVVFAVDNDEAAKVLRAAMTKFLKSKFPDVERQNDIYKRVHISTRTNRILSYLIPEGSRTAWLGWHGDSGIIPEAAVERVIHADETREGRIIHDFREIKNSYASVFLQAALLLLRPPDESGLVESRKGFFVQKAIDSLKAFAGIFEELAERRQVAVSA